MLYRITAPHFVAGLNTEVGVVVEAAPILKWALGKDIDYLKEYFKRKNWQIEILSH